MQPSGVVCLDDPSPHRLPVDRLLEFKPRLFEGRTARSAQHFRECNDVDPRASRLTARFSAQLRAGRALCPRLTFLSTRVLHLSSCDLLLPPAASAYCHSSAPLGSWLLVASRISDV